MSAIKGNSNESLFKITDTHAHAHTKREFPNKRKHTQNKQQKKRQKKVIDSRRFRTSDTLIRNQTFYHYASD